MIFLEKFTQMGILLNIYGNLLTERQRDAMDLYYNYDLSLSEIGEQLNISRQGVHDLIKRSEQIINNAEEDLNMSEIHDNTARIVGDLKSIIDEIEKDIEKDDVETLKNKKDILEGYLKKLKIIANEMEEI